MPAAGDKRASGTKQGLYFRGLFSTTKWLIFHRGIVLYNGSEMIPFGFNMHALPLKFIQIYHGLYLLSIIIRRDKNDLAPLRNMRRLF